MGSALTAWAKQEILNGTSNKFAYIEQYFDRGLRSGHQRYCHHRCNVTGILSPEDGQLFPTRPGPTALVTLPDIDTGERGTNIIQVISLNLDANHDGIMDTSLTGPDVASSAQPFVFWANNDYDRSFYDNADSTNYEDSVLIGDCPYTRPTHTGQ